MKLDEACYYLGFASGDNCNCFIYSLLQCVDVKVDVDAVRASLQFEFVDPCGPGCGVSCLNNCMKVTKNNYLNTDHWSAVLKYIFLHATGGPRDFDVSQFSLRVMELEWIDNGVVLGSPAAPRKLTVAREGGNHFVPVLLYLQADCDFPWLPW